MNRIFDRVPSRDPRNEQFPIRALLPMAEPLRVRGYRLDIRLDQGSAGACVAFGWCHELAAEPKRRKATSDLAFRIYRDAQKIDEWPGEAYEGTSVLAGAKVVKRLGYIAEYRWAFTLDDVLQTLSYQGPVVIGIKWTTGMMDTDASRYVHATGRVVGGHCVLLRAVNPSRERVTLANSWGRSWGNHGDAFLSFEDLGRLLANDGDACVPIGRR